MSPNLTYAWNFGSLGGICLVIQIITGVLLAMHYTADVSLAFDSIEHINRDVPYGWLIRSTHANGASMFFLMIYLHMWRSIYYGSYGYPRTGVWLVGMVLYLLMMATAFLGYILPWGQMSFWGATVITQLFTTIPFIGDELVLWIWGGYTVENATLTRFFSLHYLLPILILFFVIIHLIVLHDAESNDKQGHGSVFGQPNVPFHPEYTYKDILGFSIFLMLFIVFVFFYPNLLGHPENYIPADPLNTPANIVPEWYFLPFYTILRSIPNKVLGCIAMASAILMFLLLPYLHLTDVHSAHLTTAYPYLFWIFTFTWFGLLWIGSKPAVFPYVTAGQLFTTLYFSYFLILIPLNTLLILKN
jgi:ubiquinol-cytochrome c reductase cytochrome b subunit